MHKTGLKLLKFIKRYQDEQERPPSWEEMKEEMAFSSNGHLNYWLLKLEDAGYIHRLDGARNVQVIDMPDDEPEFHGEGVA